MAYSQFTEAQVLSPLIGLRTKTTCGSGLDGNVANSTHALYPLSNEAHFKSLNIRQVLLLLLLKPEPTISAFKNLFLKVFEISQNFKATNRQNLDIGDP